MSTTRQQRRSRVARNSIAYHLSRREWRDVLNLGWRHGRADRAFDDAKRSCDLYFARTEELLGARALDEMLSASLAVWDKESLKQRSVLEVLSRSVGPVFRLSLKPFRGFISGFTADGIPGSVLLERRARVPERWVESMNNVTLLERMIEEVGVARLTKHWDGMSAEVLCDARLPHDAICKRAGLTKSEAELAERLAEDFYGTLAELCTAVKLLHS